MKQAQLDLLRSIADGLSRGADEMLRVSPTDAMHPPSCSLAIRDAADEIERLRAEIKLMHSEVDLLCNALAPFAQLYLWPDDLGDETARLIRSDDDWCEATNEDADSDVFIKRKHIRAARHALAIKTEMKEDGQ